MDAATDKIEATETPVTRRKPRPAAAIDTREIPIAQAAPSDHTARDREMQDMQVDDTREVALILQESEQEPAIEKSAIESLDPVEEARLRIAETRAEMSATL